VRTLDRRSGAVLACGCGRRYPVVDGIPIVMTDPLPDLVGAVERELPPDVTALLVETAPEDAPYSRLVDHLAVYLDAHWGDRADPPVALGAHALVQKIAERSSARVKLAVELGCSVGRIVAELAAGADHVVGLDIQLATLRRARHLLAGAPVGYARRVVGRHFVPAHAVTEPVDNVSLVCGDALDPPLVHGFYDRVVALNLLDNVAQPRQLLAVVDGLCAPGGEVILATPYAWQSHVAEADRIGGDAPARELVALLREGRGLGAPYEIVDEATLTWDLRRDARCTISYRTHYVRARKRGT